MKGWTIKNFHDGRLSNPHNILVLCSTYVLCSHLLHQWNLFWCDVHWPEQEEYDLFCQILPSLSSSPGTRRSRGRRWRAWWHPPGTWPAPRPASSASCRCCWCWPVASRCCPRQSGGSVSSLFMTSTQNGEFLLTISIKDTNPLKQIAAPA